MPPKVKFRKEEIVQAALDVARVKGADGVTARDIAAQLGVSTRPIFTYFNTMDEVKTAVRQAAEQVYQDYTAKGLNADIPFLGFGLQYLRFAEEEPELYKLLFLTPPCDENSGAVAAMTHTQGLVRDSLQRIYRINAAAADVCVMAEDAELFLNAPFNAEDKVANAGSAAFAAKAGVAAVTAADAVAAAKQAASIVALLPANNLAGPALFDFAAPSKALDLVKYSAADAIAALADEGSTVELYAGYGKNIVTALATINGSAVGILATEKAALCHKCTAKAARFVRLCDAYSIPVVTVVNTEGFGKSEGDDQAGGIRQAAKSEAKRS